MADAPAELDAYHELCAYTLTLGDTPFVHQHVVDAHAAQSASADSRPITVAFALFGLYLHVERGWSGRQVQLAHVRLARRRKQWPSFGPPPTRAAMTALDVMKAGPGPARAAAIEAWCAAVWESWRGSRDRMVQLLRELR